jgi:hypothetical protein
MSTETVSRTPESVFGGMYDRAFAESLELAELNAELVEALKGLLNALPSATTHPAIKAARAVIAKAEGRA